MSFRPMIGRNALKGNRLLTWIFLLFLNFETRAVCPDNIFCVGGAVKSGQHGIGRMKKIDYEKSLGWVQFYGIDVAIPIPLEKLSRSANCLASTSFCVTDQVLIIVNPTKLKVAESFLPGFISNIWTDGQIEVSFSSSIGTQGNVVVSWVKLVPRVTDYQGHHAPEIVQTADGKSFKVKTLFMNGWALAQRIYWGRFYFSDDQLIAL